MANYDLTDFRMKYENGEYYINFLNNDTGERVDTYIGSDEELEDEFEKFLGDIDDDTGSFESAFTLHDEYSTHTAFYKDDLYEGISIYLTSEYEWFTDNYITPNNYTFDENSCDKAFDDIYNEWSEKASEFLKNN